MSENLEIFICHYKEKNSKINLDKNIYKDISVGNKMLNFEFKDCVGDNICDMNGFYSELTGYYWVWKNHEIKDYVGFCSYRRYFDFIGGNPDMSDCDIILPNPVYVGSVYKHYGLYHNILDLDLIIDIVKESYNVNYGILTDAFFGRKLYANNMFVMDKELFLDYCDFYFKTVGEYLRRKNITNIEDVNKMVETNKELYLKSFYPNNTIKYQSRIGGFLSERLLTFWVKWKDLKIKHTNVIISEDKYKRIDQKDFL